MTDCSKTWDTCKTMDCARDQLTSVSVGRNPAAQTAYIVVVPALDSSQVTGKNLFRSLCSLCICIAQDYLYFFTIVLSQLLAHVFGNGTIYIL